MINKFMSIANIERSERVHLPLHGPDVWPRQVSAAFVMTKSVCLSHSALTVQDIDMCFVPYDRGMCLVSGDQILQCWKQGSPRTIVLNRGTPLRQRKLDQLSTISQKQLKIGRKWLLFTYMKSHTCFPFGPKLVTLKDRERRNGRYFCVISRNSVALGAN